MANAHLFSLSHPVNNGNNEWVSAFASSDPTKPLIEIETIHINPNSDVFDPTKNYIGLIIYLCHGQCNFKLNGVNCQTGDIYIKEADWIEKNVRTRKGRGNYYNARLFYSIFNRWKKKKLEFVGGGFSYRNGKLEFHSRTLNTMNPNNNDDGYHNTDKTLDKFEKELIQDVFDNLYKNHRWLELSPESRISLRQLHEMKLKMYTKQHQFSADFSKVHVDRGLHGIVSMVNYTKGYAFIECLGFDEDIFAHCSDVTDPPVNRRFLTVGDNVKFNLIERNRGWKAENVTIIECD